MCPYSTNTALWRRDRARTQTRSRRAGQTPPGQRAPSVEPGNARASARVLGSCLWASRDLLRRSHPSRARRRRAPSLTGDHARLPPRAPAAQQRPPLPRRPAPHRRDRRRHAQRRPRHPRGTTTRPDRRALARRATHPRSAAAHRTRPRRTPRRVIVRRGKGGRRGEVGMDDWGWEHLRPWAVARRGLPIGPLFCVIATP
jgi:hypothetical protein